MSAIIPPLDIIPKLPGKGINLAVQQFDKLTDKLLHDVLKALKDSIKIASNNAKCSDPEVKKIKQDLEKIKQQIQKIQQQIPKVQTAISTLKTIATTAQAVNAAIAAAQLLNPVTAPLFIATQLQLIQTATVVNAVESLQQLSAVPTTVASKLASVVPALTSAIGNVAGACNGEGNEIELSEDILNELNNRTGDDSNLDYDASEWYTEQNVSDEDLSSLDDILNGQRTLLRSIIEAPSVVYKDNGDPDVSVGKPGDYYIDLQNQLIYGPKLENNWGSGVNY
jgi:DNA repair exonuclease SbcCD ATPase subunit